MKMVNIYYNFTKELKDSISLWVKHTLSDINKYFSKSMLIGSNTND